MDGCAGRRPAIGLSVGLDNGGAAAGPELDLVTYDSIPVLVIVAAAISGVVALVAGFKWWTLLAMYVSSGVCPSIPPVVVRDGDRDL